MTTIRLPKTSLQISNAYSDIVTNAPQQVLFVGQQINTSIENGSLVKSIGIDGDEDALFGRKSMLATMIREYRRIDKTNRVDAIALDDPIGVRAEAAIEVLKTSKFKGGTCNIVIQSKQLHTFTLNTYDGDTDVDIINRIVDLINDDDTLLVNAYTVLNQPIIRLECVHKGEIGNHISTAILGSVDGLFLTITPFTTGEGNPNVNNIFDIVSSIRYQSIVFPSFYNKLVVSSFLDNRFNDNSNLILDGIAIITENGNKIDLEQNAQDLDSFSVAYIGNKQVNILNYHGGAILEFSPVISSVFTAIRSLRLTIGQNVSKYLTGAVTQANTGGPAIAAVPYANNLISNLPLVINNLNWTSDEQKALNNKGVSFLGNNPEQTSIISGNIVTTKQNVNSNSVFKYLNYIDTMSNIREFLTNNIRQSYKQSVFTIGTSNGTTVNTSNISSRMLDLYTQLSTEASDGIVYRLVQPTLSSINFFKNNLKVSAVNGNIIITCNIQMVSQIRAVNILFTIDYYATI